MIMCNIWQTHASWIKYKHASSHNKIYYSCLRTIISILTFADKNYDKVFYTLNQNFPVFLLLIWTSLSELRTPMTKKGQMTKSKLTSHEISSVTSWFKICAPTMPNPDSKYPTVKVRLSYVWAVSYGPHDGKWLYLNKKFKSVIHSREILQKVHSAKFKFGRGHWRNNRLDQCL